MESLLTGESHEAFLASGEPRTVAGQAHDGCTVLAVSDRLLAALAGAEPTATADITEAWVRLQADDEDAFDAELAATEASNAFRGLHDDQDQAGDESQAETECDEQEESLDNTD